MILIEAGTALLADLPRSDGAVHDAQPRAPQGGADHRRRRHAHRRARHRAAVGHARPVRDGRVERRRPPLAGAARAGGRRARAQRRHPGERRTCRRSTRPGCGRSATARGSRPKPDAAQNDRTAWYPPTAQHAIREGPSLADNIVAALRGQPTKPFRYTALGTMASLGARRGVAELPGGFVLTGFLAWFLWRTYYLARLPGLDRQVRVAFDWTLGLHLPARHRRAAALHGARAAPGRARRRPAAAAAGLTGAGAGGRL